MKGNGGEDEEEEEKRVGGSGWGLISCHTWTCGSLGADSRLA